MVFSSVDIQSRSVFEALTVPKESRAALQLDAAPITEPERKAPPAKPEEKPIRREKVVPTPTPGPGQKPCPSPRRSTCPMP